MRVLVCGGRNYNDMKAVYRELDLIHARRGISAIIQGGARGADYCAVVWARDRKVPSVEIRAEWKNRGPAAGPLRNQRMLDEQKPDMVLAFPGGKGTLDMMRRAQKAGLLLVLAGR